MKLIRGIIALSCLLSAATMLQAQQTCNINIPESTPSVEFSDNGDGTITHSRTGLMWKRCAEGQTWSAGTCTGSPIGFVWDGPLSIWDGALQSAVKSKTGGYSDWRVPNVKELQSIVEERCYSPSINKNVFPNTPYLDSFWSASPYAGYSGDAWFVNFSDGYSYYGGYQQYANFVRLVRSGQSFGDFDARSVVNDFPTGGTLPVGWVQPAGSNAPWAVAIDSAFAGTFSLKSGTIANSQKSELSFTASFSSGNVGFARKVSSEAIFDLLQFYIDGVLQNSWSGELDWAVVNFPITAGTHTLLWRYVKDSSLSSGSDAAWIDSVTLPGVVSAPSAPSILSITPGPERLTITLQAPSNAGGGAIVGYSATCIASGHPNVTATSTTTTIIVPGLVPGVSYACTATASNGTYASPATPATSAIPKPKVDLTPLLMLLLD